MVNGMFSDRVIHAWSTCCTSIGLLIRADSIDAERTDVGERRNSAPSRGPSGRVSGSDHDSFVFEDISAGSGTPARRGTKFARTSTFRFELVPLKEKSERASVVVAR
jgi:hypothetical protein